LLSSLRHFQSEYTCSALPTFPALATLYYFKKFKKITVIGSLVAAGVGVVFIVAIQKLIIAGIPTMWASFDKFFVNSLGLPFLFRYCSGFPAFWRRYRYGLRRAERTGNGLLQRIVVALGVVVIGYTAYGMVIIRANASPPINMTDPFGSDAPAPVPQPRAVRRAPAAPRIELRCTTG
jgi:hypothetical protein